MDLSSRSYPLKVLDPSSHKSAGTTENIGDEIIKYHVNILLNASGIQEYEWVDYKYVPQPGDSLIIGGANVFGEVFSKARSSVWHPSLLGQIKRRCQAILPLGVGWWSYQRGPSFFTKSYYRSIFDLNQYMGARDTYTLKKLQLMGFDNAYLTGCPSMYSQASFSTSIPKTALLTLTNYRQNPLRDAKLISTILNHFDDIVFFPQGSSDLSYLKKLQIEFSIPEYRFQYIDRSFSALNTFIANTDFMHVGTRLHMGMHCLGKNRPSLCLSIDNRAAEMKKSFSFLPILDILELPTALRNSREFSFTPDPQVPLKLKALVSSIV